MVGQRRDLDLALPVSPIECFVEPLHLCKASLNLTLCGFDLSVDVIHLQSISFDILFERDHLILVELLALSILARRQELIVPGFLERQLGSNDLVLEFGLMQLFHVLVHTQEKLPEIAFEAEQTAYFL